MKKIVYLSLLASSIGFAQESAEQNTLMLPKISFLDSLKSTFVQHSTSNCIDERWMSELTNTELSETMFSDISSLNIDEHVSYDLSSEVIKKRLSKLDSK